MFSCGALVVALVFVALSWGKKLTRTKSCYIFQLKTESNEAQITIPKQNPKEDLSTKEEKETDQFLESLASTTNVQSDK